MRLRRLMVCSQTPIHPCSHLASIVAAWGLALAAAVYAAPPANDDLAAAVELTTGVAGSSTTVDATLEPGEPVPAGFTTASCQGTVW